MSSPSGNGAMALGRLDARTAALGVVALLCVGTLAVKTLRPGGGIEDPVVGAARPRAGGTAAVVSSVAAHDLAGSVARYKPILDADPFRSRGFRRKGEKGADKPADRPPEGSRPPDAPATVGLRLTAIYALDDGFGALLENRGHGKGIYVRSGEKLGDRSVASIGTDSIVLEAAPAPGGIAAAATRSVTLAMGDRVELAVAALAGRLADVGPVSSVTAVKVGAGAPQVQLTDQQRNDVLERLKQKRKKQLGEENR